MISWITTFFALGVVAALARLAYETITGRIWRRPREPWTTAEIAEEGRMRAAQTDVSYHYHNDIARS